MNLILASKSPRRRELLAKLGVDFTVLTEEIDETMDKDKPIAQELARVSLQKAQAVLDRAGQDALIIAADTLVCVEGRRLGKPHSSEEAAEMLRLLSGRTHQVMTGLTLLYRDRVKSEVVTTDLHFRPLCDAEIDAYVKTGEPMDKAGAYGIQGGACIFAESICGDYYNVMGLPVCRLTQLLREFGVQIFGA